MGEDENKTGRVRELEGEKEEGTDEKSKRNLEVTMIR